ncbi:MAG: molybdate ABC transporter permease subunit [Anaerolineae bacterium]|nr:molybdate ABC transporter permease subunit [Anaerolineae bacterium]
MTIPLLLSLRVAALSALLAAIGGITLASLLAHKQGLFWHLIDGIINLPLVLPPTVLGYYLLITLSQRSPLGSWLGSLGIHLTFTWGGAVVAASIVALPLVTQSARAAIESVPSELLDVARTLGRAPLAIFLTITLPLAWRGVLAGIVLAFARALGEFGATLMIAGNIPGQTQTLPIAIYDAVQAGESARANQLSLLLTSAAIVLLVSIRMLTNRISRT